MSAPVSLLAKGTLAARYAMALAINKGHLSNAAIYAESRWRGSPIVADTLKAAVTASTPADSSALIESGIAGDFIAAVRAQELISRLPALWRVPFNTPTPVAIDGFSAGWIAPGAPIRLSKLTLSSLRLAVSKIAAMTVVTSELLDESVPSAEETVRRLLVDAAASASDELERFAIVTRQRKLEQEGSHYPTAFCCYMHRVDGVSFEVGFASVESIASFLTEMGPVDCVFFVGENENMEELKREIAAAANRILH